MGAGASTLLALLLLLLQLLKPLPWLGMSRIGCPNFSLFSGHTWDTRVTLVGTRGTCPQNGVPKALKNEDTGHEYPRLWDTTQNM